MKDYKPLIVDDIKTTLLYENGKESVYSFGSVSKDRYLKIPRELLECVQSFVKYLDGNHCIDEIKHRMLNEDKIDLDVEALLNEFEKADLIVNNENKNKVEKSEFEKYFLKLIDIPIGNWCKNISQINRKIVGFIGICTVGIILLSIVLVIFNFEKFTILESYKVNQSVGVSIFISISLALISFIVHELAHAIVAAYYGLKPSNLVFGFYLTFSSMFYLKIPGIYTLEKNKKIVLWSAGVYANCVLGAISIIISLISYGMVSQIASINAIINASFVICNLSPWIPLDGYYLLSTILDQPNLRKNSFAMIKDIIIGKKEVKIKIIYSIYFILSSGFMLTILFFQIKYIMEWFVQQYNIYNSFGGVIVHSKIIVGILIICILRLAISAIKKSLRLGKNI